MAVLCEKFKSVIQNYTALDDFHSLSSLDVVHFVCLGVLKDCTQVAQPQPVFIHGVFHLLIDTLNSRVSLMRIKICLTCPHCFLSTTKNPFALSKYLWNK